MSTLLIHAAEPTRTVTLEPGRGSILLVDDDVAITRDYSRGLIDAGFAVEMAGCGESALKRLRRHRFDTVISDIGMPEMTGSELLRAIRQIDLDVPVIVMTGGPSIEGAIQAIEYGALRYLVKPVTSSELEDVVARAVRLSQLARLRREVMQHQSATSDLIGDRAGLEARFALGLERVWIAYQPIVSWAERSGFAYEALVRSDEPAMKGPGELFDAADRLCRLHDLGRIIRTQVARSAPLLARDQILFVNVHSADLEDEDLFSRDAPLSEVAGRVVLEITERAALNGVADLMGRIARLRSLGYRIAIDDLGVGYAGLTSFAQLEPDVVKLDMSLVRGAERSPTKQKLLQSLVELCRDLKIHLVAEGVETRPELDVLAGLGCDLFQGYLFARPGRPFPVPVLD
jgi:EAL domain-containing protein (putative c-di-GMP-specific phosphodiesterase class I)